MKVNGVAGAIIVLETAGSIELALQSIVEIDQHSYHESRSGLPDKIVQRSVALH